MGITGTLTILCNGQERIVEANELSLEEGGDVRTDPDENTHYAGYLYIFEEDNCRIMLTFRVWFAYQKIDQYTIRTECTVLNDDLDISIDNLYREEN